MWKMAFRNMSRNKKRTFFTMMSIVLGVGGIIFGVSYMEGIEVLMAEETTKLTGHVRIVDSDFEFKSKIMDVSSNVPYEEIKEKVKEIPEIKDIQPKIRFGAYVFSGSNDDPAAGFGVADKDVVFDKIFEGRSLDRNTMGETLAGRKLKDRMNLKLGDEITVLVSTQYGSTFAMNYDIVGFYDLNALQNKGFYINIEDAMYLLDMEGQATEVQITLYDKDKYKVVRDKVSNILNGGKYEVETWTEVGFASVMDMYKYIKIVIAIVLGLLSGIGIFNTMVMAVFERRHEIGVIKAMGMENKGIVRLFTLEGTLIGLFGSIIGIIIGSLATLYYEKNGMYLGSALDSVSTDVSLGDTIYTHLSFNSVLLALITGLVVAVIASYIPARRESKREAVENLAN